MDERSSAFRSRLNARLAEAELEPIDSLLISRFDTYCSLLLRWNARINLTAIQDEDEILSRHFVESIACAHALPAGIATLLDFGSGAGFPGIPIALCRPEIAVTLAESQGKKAAFLREAVRVLEITANVHSGRAEMLRGAFDCVTLRAVDRMQQAVGTAAQLVRSGGWLALMTTNTELGSLQESAGVDYCWPRVVPMAGSRDRVIALGQRGISSPASR
jgi:16S rRNA (guanine527-N7)-methyltransferase